MQTDRICDTKTKFAGVKCKHLPRTQVLTFDCGRTEGYKEVVTGFTQLLHGHAWRTANCPRLVVVLKQQHKQSVKFLSMTLEIYIKLSCWSWRLVANNFCVLGPAKRFQSQNIVGICYLCCVSICATVALFAGL